MGKEFRRQWSLNIIFEVIYTDAVGIEAGKILEVQELTPETTCAHKGVPMILPSVSCGSVPVCPFPGEILL
jgi:hypothetical protein